MIEAKKETYANVNARMSHPSRLNSRDYEYTNGVMTYHDTYFGSKKFMGEEVVYNKDNLPIWGMNYYGVTLKEELSEEIFNEVLRPALMKVEDGRLPLRGPEIYTNGEYKYTFTLTGTLEYFEGVEIIYKNEEKIYILKCHGGIIKK